MATGGTTQASGRRGGFWVVLQRNFGKVLALAAFAVAIVWFLWPEDAGPPAPPLTAPVQRGDIESLVAASGALEAGSSVDVGVQVSGQLTKLHVKLGDVVSKGDLLAEIDDFIQQSRVASARASLEALEASSLAERASLKLSRADLRRQERLMREKATTEVEYERAVVSLAQAEAGLTRHHLQIEQARATVEEMEALLEFTRITAPANGTVVRVNIQEGQTLNAVQQTPIILTLGNLTTIKVSAKVSEADIGALRPGMEAYFTTIGTGARRWHGRLQEISPLPQAAGGVGLAYFDALVEVDNLDGALLPGVTTKIFFVTAAARGVLKVPLGALTFTGGSGPISAAAQFAALAAGTGGLDAAPGTSRWPPAPADNAPLPSAGDRQSGGAGMSGPQDADGEGAEEAAGRAAMAQVLTADGGRETRRIRVGVSNEVEAEVTSGLSEGEMVVIGVPQPPIKQPQFPGFLG